MRRLANFACAMMFLPIVVLAQSTTQSIQGLVTDSTGGVVPGAAVILTNTGTGVARTVQTNETGNYSFPSVQVGNYELKVEMQGFKGETVKGIRVETAAQVRQDVRLQIGQVSKRSRSRPPPLP
jgi:hypothetical protein